MFDFKDCRSTNGLEILCIKKLVTKNYFARIILEVKYFEREMWDMYLKIDILVLKPNQRYSSRTILKVPYLSFRWPAKSFTSSLWLKTLTQQVKGYYSATDYVGERVLVGCMSVTNDKTTITKLCSVQKWRKLQTQRTLAWRENKFRDKMSTVIIEWYLCRESDYKT